MTDGNLAHGTFQRSAPRSDRNWARMREEVREIIRAEVDRLNPTEDARRPLELIVESSVRYADVDGELKITIVDQTGRPRTLEKDGKTIDFTIQDLLEELRLSHRILFRRSPRTGVQAAPEPQSTPVLRALPEEPAISTRPPRQPEEPERDWLNIGVSEPPSAYGSAQPVSKRIPFHVRRGRVRFHGWFRKAAKVVTAPKAAAEEPTFPFVEERPFFSLEGIKSRLAGRPTLSWSRGRGLAVAGIALAALLGIGTFALMEREQPLPPTSTSSANSDGPVQTGAVRSAQAEDTQPSTSASSANRTLRGVPDVIDTATLSLQGEVVRLFGVEWAPGGGKPDDLTSYLQGREVVCEPVGSNEAYRCQVGGQDLSRVVLFNGGGKPTAEATPELKAAADKAREARLGVWSQ